jgi:hypothetical protein
MVERTLEIKMLVTIAVPEHLDDCASICDIVNEMDYSFSSQDVKIKATDMDSYEILGKSF